MITEKEYKEAQAVIEKYEQEQLNIPVVTRSTVWTMEKLHKTVTNPDITNGFDVHLKHVWDNNNARSVFTLTGLDVSELMRGRENTSGMKIINPETGRIKYCG